MTINKLKKISVSYLSILLIIFVILYIDFNKSLWNKKNDVIEWDVISYYEYLPAFFIYDDITLKFKDNLPSDSEAIIWGDKLETGNYVVKTTMGLSFMYMPFFLAADLSAEKAGYKKDGYSPPYKFALIISSCFYLLISLLFLRKILLEKFNETVSSISILIIVLATNLLLYLTDEAAMSHTYNFALFTVFVYYTIKWHYKINFKNSLILGLTIGLITLIRPTNALITIFFLFYGIKNFKDFSGKIIIILKSYKYIFVIVISAVLTFIPQLLYWKYVTGNFIYYSYGEEGFFFNNPQTFKFLLGFRKGWLIYSPVMIFSVIGLIYLRKKIPDFFLPITLFFILNVYILSSWWSWWFGGSFGMRAMIDSYPLMIFPLASIISKFDEAKQVNKISFFMILSLCAILGIFNHIKYNYGSIHWDSMTYKAYTNSFFNVFPTANSSFFLEPPDYEAAKKGIQKTIKNKAVEEYKKGQTVIFCDMETVKSDLIMSDSTSVFFEGANFITDKESLSDKYSLKLNPKNPYGLGYEINVTGGEKYVILVSKKGNQENFIVVSGCKGKFYKQSNQIIDINNNYSTIKLEFTIPDTDCKKVKIYVWNAGKKDSFFDDYTIISKP